MGEPPAPGSYELAGRHVELDPAPIAHRDGATGTAIHGLLAASPYWTVIDADRGMLIAELDFGGRARVYRRVPVSAPPAYIASITGTTLRSRLRVTATGDVAVPISFGFHPYLTLPGSDRRSWQVELPVARQALVDDRMIPTGETESIAPGALDGPLGSAPSTQLSAAARRSAGVLVADERRRLALTFVSGYPVAQVYAPEESQFICFEPMTAPVDALISGEGLSWVQPGEELRGYLHDCGEQTLRGRTRWRPGTRSRRAATSASSPTSRCRRRRSSGSSRRRGARRSSRNKQPWDFVVVTDRAQLQELSGSGAAADTSPAPPQPS